MSKQEPISLEQPNNNSEQPPESVALDILPIDKSGGELFADDYQEILGFSEPSDANAKIPQRRVERGFWGDPANIEAEARRAIESGVPFVRGDLVDAGFSALVAAIGAKRYPGGWKKLRENLGEAQVKVERGYWEDPANIEAEAREAVRNGQSLAFAELAKSGKSSLAWAIYKKYPDGHEALKVKLGLELPDVKPDGYWNDVTTIKEEARRALNRGVALTYKGLQEVGLTSLSNAASKNYPGGINALKRDLGFEFKQTKSKGFWKNTVNIEDEARRLVASGVDLRPSVLKRTGHEDLIQAVSKYYEGGFSKLKDKLELRESQGVTVSPDQADELIKGLEEEI